VVLAYQKTTPADARHRELPMGAPQRAGLPSALGSAAATVGWFGFALAGCSHPVRRLLT
jgi:hypothetical protein